MAASHATQLHPYTQDLTGKRFCRLVVVRFFERTASKKIKWECRCDCGNTTSVETQKLKRGHTKSCGCLRDEIAGARSRSHMLSKTAEYSIWGSMVARCYYQGSSAYQWYGERGISVCALWRESFLNFLADMGERPSPNHSLERINNDGNYEPGNCRWATASEQASNRRTARRIEFRGETLSVTEWSRRTGLGRGTIMRRISEGWPLEEALTTPPLATWARKKGRMPAQAG